MEHARKLNDLRHCRIVLQYHHSEMIQVSRQPVLAMISDLCEGEPLEQWVARYPGKRLRHVDHGTAFDIAGKGIAGHVSMLEAVRLAVALAKGDGLADF